MTATIEVHPRFSRRLVRVVTPVQALVQHPTPALESRSLLQGHHEILIRHGDEVYRLRHTRNDKLILTK